MEIVKGNNFPIYAIPPNKWEDIIAPLMMDLFKMLGIDLDTHKHPERLAATEQMIREYANRLTPKEIHQAFLHYVKGELAGLEPVESHLSPILFGKVIKAYKEQKKKPPKPKVNELSDEEKQNLIFMGLVNCFDRWKQEKRVIPGYVWVYDHLMEEKIFVNDKKQKLAAMQIARRELKAEADRSDRDYIQQLEDSRSPAVINRAKLILLSDYFKGLHKDGMHLKELI